MQRLHCATLGQHYVHAPACLEGQYIGVEDDFYGDLRGQMPEDWRSFQQHYAAVGLARDPEGGVIATLKSDSLWSIWKGIRHADLVLCADGTGTFHVAKVTGDYVYAPGEVLPHRRPVTWLNIRVDRESMSAVLRQSTESHRTVCDITKHADEVRILLMGVGVLVTDATSALYEAVTALLLEADPVHIGFVDDNEYDVEAEAVLALLDVAPSVADVQTIVHAVFCYKFSDHDAGPIEQYAHVASKIREEWLAFEPPEIRLPACGE